MSRKAANFETYIRRFWASVDRSGGPEACWPWLGTRDKDGYGLFYPGHHCVRANRIAYELANGPLPIGHLSCHHCDNPPCCNPAHLYAGTYTDNNRESLRKGRRQPLRGEQGPRARLNESQILEIRIRYGTGEITQAQLAGEYGVDHTTISAIVRRVSWTHI